LLNVTVSDPSAARATAISRAVAEQFVTFASQLEKPAGAKGSRVAVTVTSPAEVPTSPSSPRKPVYLALGVLFGLMLRVGGAFLGEAVDRRIRTEADATEVGGSPVTAPVEGRGGSTELPLVVALEPASARAQTYRRLRASLSAPVTARDVRSLVVSSAASG